MAKELAVQEAKALGQVYRLLDSIRMGLSNPDLTPKRLRRLADDLKPIEKRVWR